jgi:hypothetical protein
MGHYINGFIASFADLASAARTLPQAKVCPLGSGFAFLPLTADVASPNDPATDYDQFVKLTQPIAEWAAEQSTRFPIAYVETEYFGGTGGQSAIVWHLGTVLFGPVRTGDSDSLQYGAINAAVRRLGVQRGEAVDEFAALGLGDYRDNDAWLAAVGEPSE